MRGFDASVRMTDQSARMSEATRIGFGAEFDIVSGIFESADECLIETRFEFQCRCLRAPKLPVEKTRTIDRLRKRNAEQAAREDLRLELRLAVAAHRSVGHHAPVVEDGDRR